MAKTRSKNAPFDLLKEDHEKVKKAFKEFENLDRQDAEACRPLILATCEDLKVHTTLEEEVFYPVMKRLNDEMKEELIPEAEEEHRVAKMLMAELHDMDPADEPWEAKFMVLMENVKHHIKEEEQEILPKVEEGGSSTMADRIGELWVEAKRRLMDQRGAKDLDRGRTEPEVAGRRR